MSMRKSADMGMIVDVGLWRFCVGLLLLVWVNGAPTPGHIEKELGQKDKSVIINMTSALEKGGQIIAHLYDIHCDPNVKLPFNLICELEVQRTPCAVSIGEEQEKYVKKGHLVSSSNPSISNPSISNPSKFNLEVKCGSHDDFNVTVVFPDDPAPSPPPAAMPSPTAKVTSTADSTPTSSGTPGNSGRKGKNGNKTIYTVLKRDVYYLRLNVSLGKSNTNVTFKVVVEMKNTHGYLSSLDYPMWQLYAGLVGIYSFYAALWLIMMAMNWTDLIQIQYWIGAVIALGMVEKCVFFSTYNGIKESGLSTNLFIFAQLVSCLKRTLARILVIIASSGFGIVRPHLGPMLNKLLGLGVVYFSLCALAGYFDAVNDGVQDTDSELIVNVPVIVMDAGICYWILLSLTGTMRALRVRQNEVKLTLYRHFTAAILGTVAISIVFLIWSLYVFNSGKCVEDWHEVWLKDGFWHILFSVLLLFIMIIWRPSNNIARYAYSPVSDVDTEEMEQMPSDAFEGMKLRSTKSGEEKEQKRTNSAEDDLKWVEEHIPSGVDAALPSLLDSDEELMTTKFEMSKLD